jgi:hypothetical protein
MLKRRILAPTTSFTYECSNHHLSFTIVKATMHVQCKDGCEYHEPAINISELGHLALPLVPLTEFERHTAEIDKISNPALTKLFGGDQSYLRMFIPIDGDDTCVYFKPYLA